MTHQKLSIAERLAALSVSVVAGALLLTARFLTPEASGVGTHEQLGLSPCRMLDYTGIPCPFCGMTTAVAHGAHGELAQAFTTQPAGALFGLAALIVIPLGLALAATGRAPAPILNLAASPRTWIALATILLVAWIYKIATMLAIAQ